jgi:hypothetical protein
MAPSLTWVFARRVLPQVSLHPCATLKEIGSASLLRVAMTGGYTNLACRTAAATKPANNGCGAKGFDFSSGWYCTPTNHG